MEEVDLPAFQQRILAWYATYRRDLPWRGDLNPYHVLISEIMLQQTQVDRVIPKYLAFLERFPTLESLALASTAEVLRAWQGLGYNRRALHLQRLARVVMERHGGHLPPTARELQGLPGIGRYTAHAVACFAFGAQVPVVDTNVRRVLSGFAGRDLSEAGAWKLAGALLPQGRAAEWNQALMDYGALIYKARPTRSGTPAVPFTHSNRFWRGRIIDVLRQHDAVTMPVLLQELPQDHQDRDRIRGLVRVLHEEGMVRYDPEADEVRLPE